MSIRKGRCEGERRTRRLERAAGLLVGDLEGALDSAKDEPPLGWISGDNVQALVIPVLMSWFAGWPGAELGPNLAE